MRDKYILHPAYTDGVNDNVSQKLRLCTDIVYVLGKTVEECHLHV